MLAASLRHTGMSIRRNRTGTTWHHHSNQFIVCARLVLDDCEPSKDKEETRNELKAPLVTWSGRLSSVYECRFGQSWILPHLSSCPAHRAPARTVWQHCDAIVHQAAPTSRYTMAFTVAILETVAATEWPDSPRAGDCGFTLIHFAWNF